MTRFKVKAAIVPPGSSVQPGWSKSGHKGVKKVIDAQSEQTGNNLTMALSIRDCTWGGTSDLLGVLPKIDTRESFPHQAARRNKRKRVFESVTTLRLEIDTANRDGNIEGRINRLLGRFPNLKKLELVNEGIGNRGNTRLVFDAAGFNLHASRFLTEIQSSRFGEVTGLNVGGGRTVISNLRAAAAQVRTLDGAEVEALQRAAVALDSASGDATSVIQHAYERWREGGIQGVAMSHGVASQPTAQHGRQHAFGAGGLVEAKGTVQAPNLQEIVTWFKDGDLTLTEADAMRWVSKVILATNHIRGGQPRIAQMLRWLVQLDADSPIKAKLLDRVDSNHCHDRTALALLDLLRAHEVSNIMSNLGLRSNEKRKECLRVAQMGAREAVVASKIHEIARSQSKSSRREYGHRENEGVEAQLYAIVLLSKSCKLTTDLVGMTYAQTGGWVKDHSATLKTAVSSMTPEDYAHAWAVDPSVAMWESLDEEVCESQGLLQELYLKVAESVDTDGTPPKEKVVAILRKFDLGATADEFDRIGIGAEFIRRLGDLCTQFPCLVLRQSGS